MTVSDKAVQAQLEIGRIVGPRTDLARLIEAVLTEWRLRVTIARP